VMQSVIDAFGCDSWILFQNPMNLFRERLGNNSAAVFIGYSGRLNSSLLAAVNRPLNSCLVRNPINAFSVFAYTS
jgi:hypothetical protein